MSKPDPDEGHSFLSPGVHCPGQVVFLYDLQRELSSFDFFLAPFCLPHYFGSLPTETVGFSSVQGPQCLLDPEGLGKSPLQEWEAPSSSQAG